MHVSAHEDRRRGCREHLARSCCRHTWQLSTEAGSDWLPHPHGPNLQAEAMSSQYYCHKLCLHGPCGRVAGI